MNEHVEHAQGCSPGARPIRKCDSAIAVGVIVASVLVAGVALSRLVSSEPGVQASQSETTRVIPPDTVYTPSQYVNQATEPEEHIQAF